MPQTGKIYLIGSATFHILGRSCLSARFGPVFRAAGRGEAKSGLLSARSMPNKHTITIILLIIMIIIIMIIIETIISIMMIIVTIIRK